MGEIYKKFSLGCRRCLNYLSRLSAGFNSLDPAKQKNILLGSITLVLGIGLFFYATYEGEASFQKIRHNGRIADEAIDPLNRINKGLVKDVCVGECREKKQADAKRRKEQQIRDIVGNSPISVMIPAIAERDKKVGAYLIAIAKKESDWGKHTPKKQGRECWNFWGYRGGENPTASGYSCFDSPEHAVQVVGDRIEKLISKRIDTPAKMVVWKCGSDCEAAGGQAAANKWIADVANYVRKMEII